MPESEKTTSPADVRTASTDLSRAQLIGFIARLRGELYDYLHSLSPKYHGRRVVEEILNDTSFDVVEEWEPRRGAPKQFPPTGESPEVQEAVKRLRQLAHALATQDNAITSHPMFIVEQEERIFGIESGYSDLFEYFDSDDDVVKNVRVEEDCDGYFYRCDDDGTHADGKVYVRKVYYVVRWRFVTACLTRAAADAIIERHRHNLEAARVRINGETPDDPDSPFALRPYVASAHTNKEWQDLRADLPLLLAAIDRPARLPDPDQSAKVAP